jgi:hypothetical protein
VRSIIDELLRLLAGRFTKSFACMQVRYYRFLTRSNLSIRRITKNVHLDDQMLVERAVTFPQGVTYIVALNSDVFFVNVEQTGIYYDMVPRCTENTRGHVTITVLTGGCESPRLSTALAVTSSGVRLKPFLVFKGRPGGKVAREQSAQGRPFVDQLVSTVQGSA